MYNSGMEAPAVSNEIAELKRMVSHLPLEAQVYLAPAIAGVENMNLRHAIVMGMATNALKHINDSVQQMKLDMSYLVFDLEATRRERDEALGR